MKSRNNRKKINVEKINKEKELYVNINFKQMLLDDFVCSDYYSLEFKREVVDTYIYKIVSSCNNIPIHLIHVKFALILAEFDIYYSLDKDLFFNKIDEFVSDNYCAKEFIYNVLYNKTNISTEDKNRIDIIINNKLNKIA